HPLMTAQATALSDQDIADLAAYFGTRQTQLQDLHGVK
ncbi:c-type cytochrome, partial [Xanthomonas oryzae]